jgi:short-subunit dehydrogenase
MAGLRHHHAAEKDIHIVLLKPGMTDSPMTAGMKKGPLFSSAARVGALAWRAIRRGKPVAYLPGWWRWVMLAIRSVPTAVFHRTKL